MIISKKLVTIFNYALNLVIMQIYRPYTYHVIMIILRKYDNAIIHVTSAHNNHCT